METSNNKPIVAPVTAPLPEAQEKVTGGEAHLHKQTRNSKWEPKWVTPVSPVPNGTIISVQFPSKIGVRRPTEVRSEVAEAHDCVWTLLYF